MKLILFDLDGVLVDAKDIHYRCLNQALPDQYKISLTDHRTTYDGLPTKDKLKLLSEKSGLDSSEHNGIMRIKQDLTALELKKIDRNNELIELFDALKTEGYKIGVCSNSIRPTIYTVLESLGLVNKCDCIYSADHVAKGKPYPFIYWAAMQHIGALPEETTIIEDSPVGLLAAERSGAHYIRVQSTKDVTREKLLPQLKEQGKTMPKWKDDKLNVLIPMAGEGSRFANVGYTFPKPLIDIRGKPMIQVVVENLSLDAHYIFIVRTEHRQKYALDTLLPMIAPGCDIIEVDHKTDGAACTALLATQLINNDAPLFIANSDQYVDWNPVEFMYKMQESEADGGIVTFTATHPKWSFAAVDKDTGCVTEVAEKKPISDIATVGFYYWAQGKDFVHYANQMIKNETKVNGEYYICPVFNEAIADNKMIVPSKASAMHGLGTPEDLEAWLKITS